MITSGIEAHVGTSESLPTLLDTLSLSDLGIVVGPPGSGKTHMAIQLANAHVKGNEVDLIVASEHLVSWLTPKVDSQINIQTWRKWLAARYVEVFRLQLPQEGRGSGGLDWAKIVSELETAKVTTDRIAIIDEAQDFSPRVLTVISNNVKQLIAFADPFQKSGPMNGDLTDVVDALKPKHPWPVFILEEDFRTTYEIQQFATIAWAPERYDPSRPARKRGRRPGCTEMSLRDIVVEVEGLLKKYNSLAIACSHADRGKILQKLRKHGVLVNRSGQSQPNHVSILAFEALRGLEFDAVILVPPRDLGSNWQETSAHLYVAATRAKSHLTVALLHEQFSELRESFERIERLL